MRRRDLLSGLLLVAAIPRAKAQQAGGARRIAVLMGYAEIDPEAQLRLEAFRKRLRELGWVIGVNLLIDYRWSHGEADRARALARELAEMRPDVILGETTSAVRALQDATRTIPIVFTNVSNPIGSGFVESLGRPAGNITGFSNYESSMGGKWLEVLKEIAPNVSRVAIMFNPTVSTHIAGGYYLRALDEAAQRFAVEHIINPVHNVEDIERASNMLAGNRHGELIVLPDTYAIVNRKLIVGLMAQHRVPAVYSHHTFTTDGGLISYGINSTEQYPRAASYVDRILKGEKPADLPVQAPTKFVLVINLKTAKVLGLTVPPTLLARADEVIE